jgi:hypothetical protein
VLLEVGEKDALDVGGAGVGGHGGAQEIVDEGLDEAGIGVGLDEGHELEGGLGEAYRHLRAREGGGVDELGPADQLGVGLEIRAEAIADDPGDVAGAALGGGVVELAAAAIGVEVLAVAFELEGGAVVVEEPGEAGVLAVAEVEADDLVRVEVAGIEGISGR